METLPISSVQCIGIIVYPPPLLYSRTFPQPTSCTSLFLDQSKLYFSDICKSWRVNIYLVFLERKGGPLCPDYCTFTHSHLEAGEKKQQRLFESIFRKVSAGMSIPFPVCSYPIFHLQFYEHGN